MYICDDSQKSCSMCVCVNVLSVVKSQLENYNSGHVFNCRKETCQAFKHRNNAHNEQDTMHTNIHKQVAQSSPDHHTIIHICRLNIFLFFYQRIEEVRLHVRNFLNRNITITHLTIQSNLPKVICCKYTIRIF